MSEEEKSSFMKKIFLLPFTVCYHFAMRSMCKGSSVCDDEKWIFEFSARNTCVIDLTIEILHVTGKLR